jgi:hypothetical protein
MPRDLGAGRPAATEQVAPLMDLQAALTIANANHNLGLTSEFDTCKRLIHPTRRKRFHT